MITQSDLIKGTVDFTSIKNGVNVGTLEYSMKLENPIPKVIKNIEYIEHLNDERRYIFFIESHLN